MVLTADALMDFAVPQARQTVAARDAILYALSVGYGRVPTDAWHLQRTYEEKLVPTPTLANVVAHAGPWMKAVGVDWAKVVHAEQRLTLHRPMPIATPLMSRSRMLSVVDRGEGKGMFATFERVISAEDGGPVATILQTNACRGDGGCGSAGTAPEPLPSAPLRGPDRIFEIKVPEDAALLYRLNGDFNPLHVDPEQAAQSGFARPILHGLCTFGYAGYAIGIGSSADGPVDLQSIAARFTAVVFPGETIDFHLWLDGRDVRFRGLVAARGATVLDNGVARLA